MKVLKSVKSQTVLVLVRFIKNTIKTFNRNCGLLRGRAGSPRNDDAISIYIHRLSVLLLMLSNFLRRPRSCSGVAAAAAYNTYRTKFD